MQYLYSIIQPLDVFFSQLLLVIPKLIAAYVIWIIGKWVIDKLIGFINALDIKKYKFDDRFRGAMVAMIKPLAKFLLILVILDTFGIGSNIIMAIANGLVFTIAIALGLSFGKALEPDAQTVVNNLKERVNQ